MAFKKGHNGHKRKEYPGDKPYSRYQAINYFCTECNCGNAHAKKDCKVTDCTLFPYRLGKKDPKEYTGKEIYTKAKAIKETCNFCVCNQPSLRAECVDTSCFLFPYRMGTKNPTRYIRKGIKQRVIF